MIRKATQRELKLYGMNELYPKNKRGVVLIDEELIALGLQPLIDPDND